MALTIFGLALVFVLRQAQVLHCLSNDMHWCKNYGRSRPFAVERSLMQPQVVDARICENDLKTFTFESNIAERTVWVY